MLKHMSQYLRCVGLQLSHLSLKLNFAWLDLGITNMTHFLEIYVFGCPSLFISLLVRLGKYITAHYYRYPSNVKFKEHHNRLQLTTMPTNLPERNG